MLRRTMSVWLLAAAATVGVTAGALPEAAPASAAPQSGLKTFPAAFSASLLTPDASPPGTNNWDCKPTERHPRPVVLIHGTFANAFATWNELAPQLAADGYCVFALNYGGAQGRAIKATAPIPDSARELDAFVDRVRDATGAERVDLVGHSQGGGLMPRWYLKFEGGANEVNRLVGIAPSNHGTSLLGMATLAQTLGAVDASGRMLGQAAVDQMNGSDVHRTLDAGGDTVSGVHYTTIVTRFDEVVTPYWNQYLTPGPGATVDNVTLQDHCAVDFTGHLGITYDPVALQFVRNALDPSRAQRPVCRIVPGLVS